MWFCVFGGAYDSSATRELPKHRTHILMLKKFIFIYSAVCCKHSPTCVSHIWECDWVMVSNKMFLWRAYYSNIVNFSNFKRSTRNVSVMRTVILQMTNHFSTSILYFILFCKMQAIFFSQVDIFRKLIDCLSIIIYNL